MLNKPTDWTSVNPMSAFAKGQEQTEAMLGMQKELLDAYEQASRAWLARERSEVDLWTELAAKLTATRSLPEALGTYQECVTQRMQMAAEDGRRMSEECQKLLQTFTCPLPNGWPTGSGT
jgi:Phasin protein